MSTPASAGSGPAAKRRGSTQNGPRAEARILDAAYDLLLERGLEATTVEAIAAKAGVSKVTIYKWWPNRAAVVMSAFLRRAEDLLPYPDDFRLDQVEDRLLRMTASFRGPTGAVMAALVAEGQTDPEIAQAFREGYVNARRQRGVAIVRAAIEAGEIRASDPDVVLDLLYAPLYFRLLVGHRPLDDDAVREHVRLVLTALRPS